jgi:hypothetical protein
LFLYLLLYLLHNQQYIVAERDQVVVVNRYVQTRTTIGGEKSHKTSKVLSSPAIPSVRSIFGEFGTLEVWQTAVFRWREFFF